MQRQYILLFSGAEAMSACKVTNDINLVPNLRAWLRDTILTQWKFLAFHFNLIHKVAVAHAHMSRYQARLDESTHEKAFFKLRKVV